MTQKRTGLGNRPLKNAVFEMRGNHDPYIIAVWVYFFKYRKGGRCHPSVSDYHITAVLGLAGSGWAAKLLERSGSGGGFEGGKVLC